MSIVVLSSRSSRFQGYCEGQKIVQGGVRSEPLYSEPGSSFRESETYSVGNEGVHVGEKDVVELLVDVEDW